MIAVSDTINALEYAFAAGAPGMISLTLSRWADRIELAVSDNGCGIASDGAAHGTGTALMRTLAALPDADIRRFSTDGGLRVVLSMPRARLAPDGSAASGVHRP